MELCNKYAITITMICQNTSIPTTRHTINGTGIIKVNQGCSIHSDTFSLPASSTFIHEAPLIIMPYPFSTPIAFYSWEHSHSTNISLSDSFGLEPWSVPQYIDYIQLLQKQSIPSEFSYQEWEDWLWILLPVGVIAVGLIAHYMYRPFALLSLGRSVPAQITVGPHNGKNEIDTAYTSCPHH